MKRRKFIKKAALSTTALSATSLSLFNCNGGNKKSKSSENINDKKDNTSDILASVIDDTVYIRKPIHTLNRNSDNVLAYKKAVSEMIKLPSSNPISWLSQATIHNDHCIHANWHFLTWHRAYLYYFEKICRKLSGLESFALPYWDWTLFPQIPDHFWGDNSNPLYNSSRIAGPNSTAREEFIGLRVITDILNLKDFDSFGSHRSSGLGELEGTPHNYIHRFVGGSMVTFMSPLDPIFWCHHANVDRLWAEWNSRGNSNPKDQNWLNHTFNEFSDENGNQAAIKVADMNDTSNIGYTYQTANGVLQPNDSELIATSLPTEFTLMKSQSFNPNMSWVEGSVELSDSNLQKVNDILVSAPIERERIKLKIKGITPPEDENFFVRVFINCPYLTKDTPINDPSYVASFTFFSSEHAMHHDNKDHGGRNGLEFIFDITDKYKRLTRGEFLSTRELNVQLLAIAFDSNSDTNFEIKPKEIELIRT